jgi:hypothetical protein
VFNMQPKGVWRREREIVAHLLEYQWQGSWYLVVLDVNASGAAHLMTGVFIRSSNRYR